MGFVWEGIFCHSTGCLRNRGGGGRFSSPLRNSEDLTFYHSSYYTPSVTPFGRASSLREGAGTAVPFNVPLGNRKIAGDFHRPYATQKILVFTIHRSTLPQSRPFGRDSSLREGAQPVKKLPNCPCFCYNRGNGGCFHGRLEKRRTARANHCRY